MSDQMGATQVLTSREEAQHLPGRNMTICNYCLNRSKHECERMCQPEGKYRYLEPEPLSDWEMPPQLPPFRALVDLPLTEVHATFWLSAYYLSPK